MLLAAQQKEHNTALWLLLPNASHRPTKGLRFLPSNITSKAHVTTSRPPRDAFCTSASLTYFPTAPVQQTNSTLVGHKARFKQLRTHTHRLNKQISDELFVL